MSKANVYDLLQEVVDPEVGINIVDLGLVYSVAVERDTVEVQFTLTYPGCPLGPEIKKSIIDALMAGSGAAHVSAKLVWEPGLMSDEARVSLGYPI